MQIQNKINTNTQNHKQPHQNKQNKLSNKVNTASLKTQVNEIKVTNSHKEI